MDADRLARWYRWVEYAAFGRALERSRFAFLHQLCGARRVLVLGEGDGRMLRRMLVAAPQAEFIVLEASAKMIAQAQARAGLDERVRFVQGDARSAALGNFAPYDAVVTCFFLDCFEEGELRRFMARIATGLAPGGVWLVSDFAIPEEGWRRWHARAWVAVMYRFFGAATGLGVRVLPRIELLLGEAGLVRRQRVAMRGGLIVASVWEKC